MCFHEAGDLHEGEPSRAGLLSRSERSLREARQALSHLKSWLPGQMMAVYASYQARLEEEHARVNEGGLPSHAG
jgi:hypothetical protein